MRQHISMPQFMGFFFANMVGMLIVMLAVQFYIDSRALYSSEDSFMKEDYLILSKEVTSSSLVNQNANAFRPSEIEDVAKQDFVEQVGVFQPSSFQVKAKFGLNGTSQFSTDFFFESVPDTFVDVKSEDWIYRPGSKELPIILPRTYMDLYNFGFAQSMRMPKISEGLLRSLSLTITISTEDGKSDDYDGRIVGFSSRLNTILVPQSFLNWAENHYYTGGKRVQPTRLILRVNNPADENIPIYLKSHKYLTDQDKLQTSKTNYVLRILIGIVMIVGLIISILSFYVLMLSVFLLVQKNSRKLQDLLLLGYSPTRVALPYQILTVSLSILVLVLACLLLLGIRHAYLAMFHSLFPDLQPPSMWVAFGIGFVLMLTVSVVNSLAIHRKVIAIWKNKD